MGVQVDEPGRDDQPARVDLAVSPKWRLGNNGDPAIADPHMTQCIEAAVGVDHPPMVDDQ